MRRIVVVAFAAALFVGLAAPSASAIPVHCVEQTHRGACYELIWVDGDEVTMTFPHAGDPVGGGRGNRSTDVMTFYVVAPQTETPQATLPFVHDHVVPAMPGEPGYSPYLEGYLVLCSEEGLTSGACEATFVEFAGATLPLATSINGEALTSVEPIESAVDEGLVVLLLGGPAFLGTISPSR